MTHHPTSPCPHCGLARDAVPVGKGADIAALAKAWVEAATTTARVYPDHRIPHCMLPEYKVLLAALAANAAEIERRVADERERCAKVVERIRDVAVASVPANSDFGDVTKRVFAATLNTAIAAIRVQAEGGHDDR